MSGLDDPRVHEFRRARADVMAGLSAPAGARDRYRAAIGPYLDCMDQITPADSTARRHLMESLVYNTDDDGPPLPLVSVLAAFRATKEEAEWLRTQKPVFRPEPIDEQDRLQQLYQRSYAAYLRTDHWKRVRDDALVRAEYRCQLCNAPERLEVHHRNYDHMGAERPADVTVLCGDCHGRHHGKLPRPPRVAA